MEITIRPQKRLHINFQELWRYKELFYFLAWRDVKVRYKQTVIGIVWAILQPLLTMVIFTFFFNRVAGVSSGTIPYPVFSYIGLLFWNYFSSTLTDVSNSLVGQQTIITKIFFPRIIIPISVTFVGLIDFLIAFIFLFVLLIFYHVVPQWWGIGGLLLSLLLTISAVWAIGLFLAILNVKYRDVRYALPFFIQLVLFLTPVIYPVSLIPKAYQLLLYINPMTAAITFARFAMFNQSINWTGIGISLISISCMLVISIWYFSKYESSIADII